MVINGILNIKTIYLAGLIAVVALMPWSTHWCANAITLTLILGILTTPISQKLERIKQNPSVLTFIGLYILYLIGILYTTERSEGWISLEQKLFLIGLPVIVATSFRLSQNQIRFLLQAFIFSNLALTIFNLGLSTYTLLTGKEALYNFDIYTHNNFSQTSYASELWSRFSYISLSNHIIDPTYFSIYLVFCIAVVVFFKVSLPRLFKWFIVSWFSLFILLLASRMGIVLLGLVLLIAILLTLETSPIKKSVASILTFGSLAIVIFLFPVTRFRMIEEPLSTSNQLPSDPTRWNSTNLRLMEWKSGLLGIRESGFFGTGTGGTWAVLKQQSSKQNLGMFSGEFNVHNQYLETLLEIGVAGFLVLMLCYITPLLHALNVKDYLLLSLILILCLSSLTESILERANGLIFFTSFVAILMYSGKYDAA